MYYDYYNDFVKQYKPGISKIQRITKQFSLDKNLHLFEKRSCANYQLHFSKQGVLTSLIKLYYNQENKLKEIIRYVYAYDKHKNILIILGYDFPTNVLHEKVEFIYNSDSQILKEFFQRFSCDGDLDEDIECHHLYKGDYHRLDLTNRIEETEHFLETWYDSNAGTVECKLSEGDGEILDWTKATYNKRGELIREQTLNDDGSLNYETEHFYEKNKVIRLCYENKEVYETYTEFDDHQNWISKTFFMNGELYSIEEQKIEYY